MLNLIRLQPITTVLSARNISPVFARSLTSAPASAANKTAVKAPRLSGLQKQVIALYRETLRAARQQPLETEARVSLAAYVVTEFRSKAKTVEKLDIQRIEHLMRQGRKKMTALTASDGGISGFGVVGGHVPAYVRMMVERTPR